MTATAPIDLFLCGDVMTGRGIDQALPHPCPPGLHEPCAGSALDYVRLAEQAHGTIARPMDFADVWGDALGEWRRRRPDLRIVNLETSITLSEAAVAKGINYRMSPANAACLTAAQIDCCVLANNHVLDWGRDGLLDTLTALERLGIATAGAGRDRAAARSPAVLGVPGKGRVLVVGLATPSSGVPPDWAASDDTPGVNLVPELNAAAVAAIAADLARERRDGDVAVASIHWGANWGHAIPDGHRRFARALIDEAGVAVVHGHSAHHAKAIEIHGGGLILYGCGDFVDDYEGIEGDEAFRGDLAPMYFARVDPARGALLGLDLVPLRMRRFRLARASTADAAWLRETLERESPAGTRFTLADDGRLALVRDGAAG